MEKPNYLGFAVLELSNLLTYETFYDTLQPSLGEKTIQCHHIDPDAFVWSINSSNIIKDL